MDSNEELLLQLQTDLRRYRKMLKDASTAIVEQGVSNYPIFIAHRHIANLGLSLLDKTSSKTTWSLNVSTLEEFVTKKIIAYEGMDKFKQIYKNPSTYMCVFVLEPKMNQFVFYAYDESLV